MAGAGFKDFVAGEVLTADQVDTYLMQQAVMRFASSGARGSAIASPSEGMITTLDDTDAVERYDGSVWAAIGGGGGKILQVVRDTDSTERTTTSGSFVDVTGMSITITPQKSDSIVLLIATGRASTSITSGSNGEGIFRITDNSNNPISGAESSTIGHFQISYTNPGVFYVPLCLIGYATPATTSTVTYKLQFLSNSASSTTRLQNQTQTGQIYAIEVAA